jgi:hypothetical protein
MATISEVLHQYGYAAPEDTVAANLAALLTPRDAHAAVDLSAADQDYLVRFSGVRTPTPGELSALDARTAARATVEAVAARSRSQVAALLGVDVTRVSHQTTAGDLFSYAGGRGRSVYPDWQFTGRAVLPHLRAVLAAFPAMSHPVPVRAFMTSPDDALTMGDRAVSPREWLVGGGDPDPVIGLAATLGEQV